MGLTKAKLANWLANKRHGGADLPPAAQRNLAALEGLRPELPLEQCRFVVLDLETTGLDLERGRIIAAGALRMAGGRIQLGDCFHELVNPATEIPDEAIKVHGITPDRVRRARHGALVLEDFLLWLGGDIVVAHYARFDLNFLDKLMRQRYGFTLQNLVLDTVRMCRDLVLPDDPYGIRSRDKPCRLDNLARRFGIDQSERHSALGDALATALIFQRMLGKLEEAGGATLKDLLRVALVR